MLGEARALAGAETVGGLGPGQAERGEALVGLGDGEDSGDGCYLSLSVPEDPWQCDAPSRAAPGARGR